MKNALLTSLSMLAIICPAMAQDKAMDLTKASTEAQYRTHLMGLGGMSLMASEIAVKKASSDKVKEFAEFEVSEQTAISSVLKDLKTPKPPMSAEDKAMMEKLQAASGADFDAAYVKGSLATHEKLKALGESYTGSATPAKAGAAEQEARHLATLTLPTIKQHIAQAKELQSSMR